METPSEPSAKRQRISTLPDIEQTMADEQTSSEINKIKMEIQEIRSDLRQVKEEVATKGMDTSE